MSTAFLFLDECFSARLDLAALTGVLVPADRYAAVRDAVCGIVWDCLRCPPHTILPSIELHAGSLLNDLSDRDANDLDQSRLAVFRGVARIVNEHQLRICRIAYTNHKEVAAALEGDPSLYGLTFFGIQQWLGPIMADTLVMPVMDGVPDSSSAGKPPRIDRQLIRAFAAGVRWIHHYRASGHSESHLSIQNPTNLAEPVFGDSAHSVLLQLVDIVSYLLHQIEKDEHGAGGSQSEFGKAVLTSARSIQATLVHGWRGPMILGVGGTGP